MENTLTFSFASHDPEVLQGASDTLLSGRATPYRRSYVNDAVDVLRSAGRSMKLQELQAQIREKRGKDVSLGSLKVCLSRYVDTADASKLLTRVAPGLFALSEWDNIWTSRSVRHQVGGDAPDFIHLGSTDKARERQDPANLLLFKWSMPANPELNVEEQRVYVRAESREAAIVRLEQAGVETASHGHIEETDPVAPAPTDAQVN